MTIEEAKAIIADKDSQILTLQEQLAGIEADVQSIKQSCIKCGGTVRITDGKPELVLPK